MLSVTPDRIRRNTATLCAAAALLLVGCSDEGDTSASGDTAQSGAESAVPTRTTTVTETAVPAEDAAPLYGPAVSHWFSHGISMTLAEDGTGDLELCSGMVNPANWDLTWSGSGPDIDIVVGDMTREAENMNLIREVSPGQELAATISDPGTLELYGYLPEKSWPLNATDPVPDDWECGGPSLTGTENTQ